MAYFVMTSRDTWEKFCRWQCGEVIGAGQEGGPDRPLPQAVEYWKNRAVPLEGSDTWINVTPGLFNSVHHVGVRDGRGARKADCHAMAQHLHGIVSWVDASEGRPHNHNSIYVESDQ
jgi:hypothetical protein